MENRKREQASQRSRRGQRVGRSATDDGEVNYSDFLQAIGNIHPILLYPILLCPISPSSIAAMPLSDSAIAKPRPRPLRRLGPRPHGLLAGLLSSASADD